MSEVGHYQTQVKRDNFVRLFLGHEYGADVFVATHLYGIISGLTADVPAEEIEEILGTAA